MPVLDAGFYCELREEATSGKQYADQLMPVGAIPHDLQVGLFRLFPFPARRSTERDNGVFHGRNLTVAVNTSVRKSR